MKLNYLALPNGNKLIPYHNHDFKGEELDGVYYFIDGFQDYIRTSHPNLIKNSSINAVISTIREEFKWTSVYNKDLSKREKPVTRLLKDLDDEHLEDIIIYLQQRIITVKNREGMSSPIQQMKFTIEIMRAEIRWRKRNEKKENKT
jgi:hypothetical protein